MSFHVLSRLVPLFNALLQRSCHLLDSFHPAEVNHELVDFNYFLLHLLTLLLESFLCLSTVVIADLELKIHHQLRVKLVNLSCKMFSRVQLASIFSLRNCWGILVLRYSWTLLKVWIN